MRENKSEEKPETPLIFLLCFLLGASQALACCRNNLLMNPVRTPALARYCPKKEKKQGKQKMLRRNETPSLNDTWL